MRADRSGEKPVTVCIAAVCTVDNQLIIIGASDRMISAPDLKFEPPQSKVYGFATWVVALIAGDPYIQMSICDEVARVLKLRPAATVEAVARIYAEAFSNFRRQFAENKYLKPVGLDVNSFLDRQLDFQASFISDLQHNLQNSPLEVETIITGVDENGPHIFVITDPGDIACADGLAFAAIGSGKYHADWQFMMAKYTRQVPVHKALLLTYLAKKRAEVSPTVGEYTDLFFIELPKGYSTIADNVHQHLSDVYDRFEMRNVDSMDTAEEDSRKFYEDIRERGAGSAEEPPNNGASRPKRGGKRKK